MQLNNGQQIYFTFSAAFSKGGIAYFQMEKVVNDVGNFGNVQCNLFSGNCQALDCRLHFL